MRKIPVILLLAFFAMPAIYGQIKIGDNPQAISPTSVLELESNDRVLVITRVTTAQMNAIVPLQGALVYNTEVQSVHYYDGTQWVNIGGGGTSGALTADPIVNDVSTIVITPNGGADNLEVAPNSIGSLQIINGGINGVDIQNGSIGPGKLQNQSVTQEKLSENSVGAFALDNAGINLSDFNNDLNLLTISGEAGNDLIDNNGAFYDDQTLQDDIAANTTAINAIGTPTLNEVLQEGRNAGNQTIEGLATPINPADAATKAYVDDEIANAAGSDNQNLTSATLNPANNELTIAIEDGNPVTVDLDPLAGGGGTTELADGITITGAGTAGDRFRIEPGANDQILTTDGTGTVVWQTIAAGGSTEVADLSTILGVGTGGDPFRIAPGSDGQFLTTNAAGDPVWLTVAPGGSTELADQVTITGDGQTGTEFQVADGGINTLQLTDDAVTTLKILDANVTAGKIAPGGNDQILRTASDGLSVAWVDLPTGAAVISDATLTGDGTSAATALGIAPAVDLTPAADQMLITTDAGDIAWAKISGTPNSVFYAGPDGLPTTVDDNASANDDRGFYWDPNGRDLGGPNQFGALYIGLEPGNAQSDEAKVHIADNFPGLTYSLHLQNFNNSNPARTTGILFSTVNAAYGKGSLIFDTQGGNGIGDFHFLQNNAPNTNLPDIDDKAFTIKNNKDIRLYGGIDVDGTATGLGTAGQVLTSTGAGVQWTAGGGSGTVFTDGATITGNGAAAATQLSIPTGGVTTNEILDATIANGDLGPDAVTSDKILDGEIQTADIEDLSVTDAKIAPGGADQILRTDPTGAFASWVNLPAGGAVSSDGTTIVGDGSATDLSVPTDGITTTQIADGTIVNIDIDGDAITTDKILDGEVQTADIEDLGVTDAKIAPGGADQILRTDPTGAFASWVDLPAGGAVSSDGTTIVGDGSATDLSVPTNGITTTQIADGTVANIDIDGDAITTDKILDGEVQTNDIATDAVTADKIADGAISGGAGGDIVDGSITASDLDADSVDAAEIRIDAVGQSEIQTGGVATDEILDGTIANIDVAAGAAIDGSKITPIFLQDVETTGVVISGGVTMNVPDYVFQKYFLGNSDIDKNYEFKKLEEVEVFIKKYHHLPGIKSIDEVKKDGTWDLSQSNLNNLEKIEELFLHTIEQENKIKSLESANDTLTDELKSMKKDLEEIKAMLKKSN